MGTYITMEALGVDVIAIGIPTVVDAATIVMDTLEDYTQKTKHSLNLRLFMEDYDSTLFHELQKISRLSKTNVFRHRRHGCVRRKRYDGRHHHRNHCLTGWYGVLCAWK